MKSAHYKIHIQPKEKYLLWTLYKVMEILNDSEHCYAFKCNIIYDRSIGIDVCSNIPIIIIYCVKGEDSYNILLNQIITAFSDINKDEIGLNCTPRFNTKHNSLIYSAQGDGDLKEYMLKNKIIDQYWDKNTGYAFALPKYRVPSKKRKRKFTQL